MTPPSSSVLQKRLSAISTNCFFVPSTPLPYRSCEEDSGLESMKTSPSDSGSFEKILGKRKFMVYITKYLKKLQMYTNWKNKN